MACNPNAVPPAVNCTFEKGICDWIQDPYDQFDWLRNNGSTASRNTGPMNDHTRGDASGRRVTVFVLDKFICTCLGTNMNIVIINDGITLVC